MNGTSPRLNRSRLVIGAAFAALVAALVTAVLIALNATTVAFVIRHADKQAAPPDDPPLSSAGQTRALALQHAVGSAGISAIYVTEFQRTQQTVAPLAAGLGITPALRPMADWQGVVDDIRVNRRGATVLVCGHTGTVPQIIAGLSGVTVAPISESQYDHLYMVVIPRWSAARVVHLKYGQPTS